MNREQIRKMLEEYKAGSVSINEVLDMLVQEPFTDMGYARIDDHRSLRDTFCEVVFCQGKEPAQVAEIMAHLAEHNDRLLGTRASEEVYKAVRERVPDICYHPRARLLYRTVPGWRTEQKVAVVTAGTADLPVAEEAALCLETMGVPVVRLFDVGVAGIHRVLHNLPVIREVQVVIVVAGMEGALASVVGGLTHRPVIAVPTSVGYGASFNGLAALLSMLNSCAPGVGVVNIDNGYGAAALALAIIESNHG
ncbi:MAG TPA: nickel pincer cofactor biosynthesis protein LarB [Syntrophomonadaceae bacterium]|jgi:NCAIR mutase (PurE)-related protein|nr:nickel pincer cofactor biosynthesis protein LarB [Syntrophomonadaceae bacterium]HOQ09623.1 nickel pincer cofactor biosynthesis protein LarB [Syntrophomonadaceae bacterium]HPU48109.1 nickel pincer cofactor biosynthesis protein LarB [Syntrophomonadaceae bacterium]